MVVNDGEAEQHEHVREVKRVADVPQQSSGVQRAGVHPFEAAAALDATGANHQYSQALASERLEMTRDVTAYS